MFLSPADFFQYQLFRIYGTNMFVHALIFAVTRGSCLNTRLIGRVFKQFPRDPAIGNAMNKYG